MMHSETTHMSKEVGLKFHHENSLLKVTDSDKF